ncbi:MAG TPA: M28 family peptidase [Candidatus Tectomicrobia bacterium]|nr:M28 family peptidase [Candidatus Tectomicrobia bacterium]
MWVLGTIVLIAALSIGGVLWMTAVPGRSHEGPLPPLTPEQGHLASRLRAHITSIASTPHNTGYPHELEDAASYIEARLAETGYELHRQTFQADGHNVRNIEVVIEPNAIGDTKTLVIGAHYDSYFHAPGANDNATGTAGVIELARLLADLKGRSAIRIRLVLFVNEEPPYFKTELMGSLIYARRLKQSGEPILGMLSLETIGFYSDAEHSQRYPPPLGLLYPTTGNFVAFVGLTSSRAFVRRTVGSFRALTAFPSVGGTAPAIIPGIDWSDHWSFEQVGIPAVMVTDTALFRYPHYHTPADTPDKVDYESLARVVSGLELVIREWSSRGVDGID